MHDDFRRSFMRRFALHFLHNFHGSITFQFGDGIMSMIDCKITLDKKQDPRGDRMVLSFEWDSR